MPLVYEKENQTNLAGAPGAHEVSSGNLAPNYLDFVFAYSSVHFNSTHIICLDASTLPRPSIQQLRSDLLTLCIRTLFFFFSVNAASAPFHLK